MNKITDGNPELRDANKIKKMAQAKEILEQAKKFSKGLDPLQRMQNTSKLKQG